MKNITKKLVLSVIALILVFAATITVGFAYWGGFIKNPEPIEPEVEVQVGKGYDVETTLGEVNFSGFENKKLVPVGHEREEEGEVSLINILIDNILWKGNGAKGAVGTLVVDKVSIEINNEDYTDLFELTLPENKNITAETATSTNIIIKFVNEPATKEVYDLIKEGTLIIKIKISVEVPNQ